MDTKKPTPTPPSEQSEGDEAKARSYFVVDPRKVTGKDLYERILAMREQAPKREG